MTISEQIKVLYIHSNISMAELARSFGKSSHALNAKLKRETFKQMICIYDEFSVNTYMNRIIKATTLKLMHTDIDKTRKKI